MSTVTALPLPALVTAVCAAFALSGCGVSIDIGGGDATERTETQTLDATAIERIRIDTGNGRVAVTGDDVGDITVTALLRESDEGDAGYVIEEQGDTLVIEGRCDAGWLDQCSVGFEITAPDDVAIEVRTDNGRIDVAAVAGPIDVETDNGQVVGNGLTAPDVHARSDNGGLELTFAATPDRVSASTDNGSIDVRFPDDGGAHDVSASTDNGSVDVGVRTDPASERTVTAESDNGSIVVRYVP